MFEQQFSVQIFARQSSYFGQNSDAAASLGSLRVNITLPEGFHLFSICLHITLHQTKGFYKEYCSLKEIKRKVSLNILFSQF